MRLFITVRVTAKGAVIIRYLSRRPSGFLRNKRHPSARISHRFCASYGRRLGPRKLSFNCPQDGPERPCWVGSDETILRSVSQT